MSRGAIASKNTPKSQSPTVRLRMQRTAQRNNKYEAELRSALFRKGLRFRIHYRVPWIPRRSIDIALVRRRIAIFVDGCFWHCCPLHGTLPKTNSVWWAEKLRANSTRDADTDSKLRSANWTVIRVWEHEVPIEAANRIVQIVSSTTPLHTSDAKPRFRM